MKIREDRSHMNIDTRWFEKGYAKEDVHSLRLQSLCTEAEAAANKQFYDSHTCEEWEQYTAVASVIGQIRRKLTPDTPKGGYIRTVLGSGYKFNSSPF